MLMRPLGKALQQQKYLHTPARYAWLQIYIHVHIHIKTHAIHIHAYTHLYIHILFCKLYKYAIRRSTV